MIKVLIVDDKIILRNGIKAIIEQDMDICVVGNASNGLEALEECKKVSPDIVLMDIEMPVCDGIEGTRIIKEYDSSIKVIVLTVFEDNERITMALKNGADGYLLKDIRDEELIDIIKYAIKGFSVLQQSVFKNISDRSKVGANQYSSDSTNTRENIQRCSLTDREIDITKLIVDGYSNKQIASELSIAEGTVRNIVSNLLAKLDLYDRTQLAVYVIKNGIV